MEGCFLCQKGAAAAEHDRDNLVLYRGERVFVVLNLFPYTNGHLMVAPYAHVGELPQLDADAAAELMALATQCVAALQQLSAPDGFNLGMNLGRVAGAGLADHLHLHVVPRWLGDHNYMSVVGQTRLVPEALDVTYDRLKPYFQS